MGANTKCAKKTHTCCTCRHRCQNVNGVRNVACSSYFTASFGPPTYRVPTRFKATAVWLCERHAKPVFFTGAKQRPYVKRPAPVKRARAATRAAPRPAPRACEGSVAFDSGGAAESEDGDASEGDYGSDDAAPSDESDGDASEEDDAADDALGGEHVVDMDDSAAFEHTMKKAKKNVKRQKKFDQMRRGEASGMTGDSDGARWRMVAH